MCFFWRKKREDNTREDEIELVKLITVYNCYELGAVEGVLKDNNIPYIVREEGAGGILKIATGVLLTAADIMVEKSFLKKAKDLTDIVINESTDEIDEDEED